MLAKHSKSFSLIDCISVGVDRMQRNFEPMRKQVETWQRSELTDVTAKVVIYEAFVEGRLEAPKHLARTVHDLYFEPKYDRPSFKIGNCYEKDHTCTLKQSLDSTLTKLAHCDRPFVVPSSAPMTRCRQGVAWKGRNAAPSCFSALAEVT